MRLGGRLACYINGKCQPCCCSCCFNSGHLWNRWGGRVCSQFWSQSASSPPPISPVVGASCESPWNRLGSCGPFVPLLVMGRHLCSVSSVGGTSQWQSLPSSRCCSSFTVLKLLREVRSRVKYGTISILEEDRFLGIVRGVCLEKEEIGRFRAEQAGAEVKATFNSSKEAWHSSFHLKGTLSNVMWIRGREIVEKFRMNLRQKLDNPRNPSLWSGWLVRVRR